VLDFDTAAEGIDVGAAVETVETHFGGGGLDAHILGEVLHRHRPALKVDAEFGVGRRPNFVVHDAVGRGGAGVQRVGVNVDAVRPLLQMRLNGAAGPHGNDLDQRLAPAVDAHLAHLAAEVDDGFRIGGEGFLNALGLRAQWQEQRRSDESDGSKRTVHVCSPTRAGFYQAGTFIACSTVAFC